MIDLGMTAKVRPCLVLSDYPEEDELALLIVVPHTTATRGNKWEVQVPLPFLRQGAFHLQQIQPVSLARLELKLGIMPPPAVAKIREAIVRLLHLTPAS
jgi:mRNA interferase MazF